MWATYESYGIESRRAGTRGVKLFNAVQVRGQRAPSLNTLELAEAQLKTAVKIRPDDANANFYLGELSVMRYRHLQAEQLASDLETQIAELEKLKAFSEEESNAEVLARREQINEQQEALKNIKNFSDLELHCHTGASSGFPASRANRSKLRPRGQNRLER